MLSKQAILQVSGLIADPNSKIEVRHLGVLVVLATRPMSKLELAALLSISTRTIERYFVELKEANLIAQSNGNWRVVDFLVTTDLSPDYYNHNNQLIKTNQKTDQNQIIPEDDLREAAALFGRPWLLKEIGKIVVQEFERAGKTYSKYVLIEAVRHTVRETRNPATRRKRGLPPVKNMLGYFRMCVRNMLTQDVTSDIFPAGDPSGTIPGDTCYAEVSNLAYEEKGQVIDTAEAVEAHPQGYWMQRLIEDGYEDDSSSYWKKKLMDFENSLDDEDISVKILPLSNSA